MLFNSNQYQNRSIRCDLFAQMLIKAAAAAALLVSGLHASATIAQKIITPRPGSIGRTQILNAIRSQVGLNIRYTVYSLRVVKGKRAAFAYAAVEPSKKELDGGEYILESGGLRGSGKWRVIWAVSGGGTADCADAADYYQSVTRHLKTHGISADSLNPEHTAQKKIHAAAAAADQNCVTIGDLGPDIEAIGI